MRPGGPERPWSSSCRPDPNRGPHRTSRISDAWARPVGAFRSVKELVARIEAFIANWNAGASPFVWVKSADEILAKAVRKPRATNEP